MGNRNARVPVGLGFVERYDLTALMVRAIAGDNNNVSDATPTFVTFSLTNFARGGWTPTPGLNGGIAGVGPFGDVDEDASAPHWASATVLWAAGATGIREVAIMRGATVHALDRCNALSAGTTAQTCCNAVNIGVGETWQVRVTHTQGAPLTLSTCDLYIQKMLPAGNVYPA